MRNILENPNELQSDQYYDFDELESEQDKLKRSVSALARNGLLQTGKRNVALLARLASMPRPVADVPDKRSIATLAKNGQLPSREPDAEDITETQWHDYKRNIGSLARSGQIGKRNVGSLARDYVLPNSGKRNLPSILQSGGSATTNDGQQQPPTRNAGLLASDSFYPFYRKRDVDTSSTFRMYQYLIFFYFFYVFVYFDFIVSFHFPFFVLFHGIFDDFSYKY